MQNSTYKSLLLAKIKLFILNGSSKVGQPLLMAFIRSNLP